MNEQISSKGFYEQKILGLYSEFCRIGGLSGIVPASPRRNGQVRFYSEIGLSRNTEEAAIQGITEALQETDSRRELITEPLGSIVRLPQEENLLIMTRAGDLSKARFRFPKIIRDWDFILTDSEIDWFDYRTMSGALGINYRESGVVVVSISKIERETSIRNADRSELITIVSKHEMGHVLGLDQHCENDCVMSARVIYCHNFCQRCSTKAIEHEKKFSERLISGLTF